MSAASSKLPQLCAAMEKLLCTGLLNQWLIYMYPPEEWYLLEDPDSTYLCTSTLNQAVS